LVYEVAEGCHNKKSKYSQDQDDEKKLHPYALSPTQLFLLSGAPFRLLQLLGLTFFAFVQFLPAALDKLASLRTRAENLCRWRIQILLCFTQLDFLQRFIGFALNIFFQLRTDPLRVPVSRKPLMVRLLYWFDEAIVGQLVCYCAGAVLAAYNMSFFQFL